MRVVSPRLRLPLFASWMSATLAVAACASDPPPRYKPSDNALPAGALPMAAATAGRWIGAALSNRTGEARYGALAGSEFNYVTPEWQMKWDPTETGPNVFNYSLGFEYRIAATEKVSLYPRAGYRRFNAPWDDKDNLPMTGDFKLLLDTKGSHFNIVTMGMGVSLTDDKGKLWVIDLGLDFGGDTFNMALGFTYEI